MPPLTPYTNIYKPVTPKIQINTSGYTKPKSTLNPNQYLKDIIDKMGSTLQAPKSITGQLSYDNFADPYRKTFAQFENMNMRPEYERFQLNPFQRNYANTAAAGNAMYAGNGRRQFADENRKIDMGYQDQVEEQRNRFEGLARQFYDQRIQKMGNSPIALTNI